MCDARELVDEGLISIDEAASFLMVSRSTVYKLIKQGQLPPAHLGRSARLPLVAVKQLAARSLGNARRNAS